MSIGDNIRRIRKEKGLSMKSLGKMVDVSEQAIGNYERGDRKASIEMLNKIANVFGVPISKIIDDSETLANKLIKILDTKIFKNLDAENTWEVIWELTNINGDLLDKCTENNEELPEEDLLKILKFIQKENYNIFITFISENIDTINKFKKLKDYCNSLLLEHRRIEYIKKLHQENPNDKKISNLIEKINSTGILSDEDIKIIDSYKEAECVNNFLGGDLPIISGAENDAFDLFKKLLIALGYSKDKISGYNSYLFKKIKAQIELEIKMIEDQNK